jgi:cbb3-type cytochrome oxidase maturation protein
MSVIYLLISISIVVALAFLIAFLRAVKSGQYDDDYTPSVRMLFDDELVKKKSNSKLVTSNSKEINTITNQNNNKK